MDSTTWLAVLAGVVGSPALLAYITGRQRRKEKREDAAQRQADKREDWKRQDEVAARAAEATEQVARAARLLVASNAEVAHTAAASAAITNGKLDQIHDLVNSTLTEAMQDALSALVQQVVLTQELTAFHTAEGRAMPESAAEALAAVQAKVDELRSKLADRKKQTENAAAQIAQQKT